MIVVTKKGALPTQERFLTVCKHCGGEFTSCLDDWQYFPSRDQRDEKHWTIKCPTEGCNATFYKYR